jgi:hypothetical protein
LAYKMRNPLAFTFQGLNLSAAEMIGKRAGIGFSEGRRWRYSESFRGDR